LFLKTQRLPVQAGIKISRLGRDYKIEASLRLYSFLISLLLIADSH